MKVGKIPVASIVLVNIGIISYAIRHYNPSGYGANSQFIDGTFFGATLVYLLYYMNIWITAYGNNKKEWAKTTMLYNFLFFKIYS